MWTYKICYICGPSTCVAICGFAIAICRPNIFCDLWIGDLLTQICCRLTTSANLQIHYFSAYKYIPKCSNSNFYQIKNSAKRTYSRLLDSFAIKGGIFLKRCLILSVLWWKICRLTICGLYHQQNFADLQFAYQSKEICRLTYLRNLRICDCVLRPRICGFSKRAGLGGHLCKFDQRHRR